MIEHITDIEDCPLGQALRTVREGDMLSTLDRSSAPLGQFAEAIRRRLAKQRARFVETGRRLAERNAAERHRQQRSQGDGHAA